MGILGAIFGSVWVIIFIITLIIFGLFGKWLAEEKGYDGGIWFWLCLLLGPLPFLAICGAPDKSRKYEIGTQQLSNISRIVNRLEKKKCTRCKKEVDISYTGCPHCGNDTFE
jgi:hypothetical protein